MDTDKPRKRKNTMKNTALITYLDNEAARFTNLAKDIALKLLKLEDIPEGSPEWLTLQEQKGKAHDHLIRAETYKDAARIAAGQIKPKRS